MAQISALFGRWLRRVHVGAADFASKTRTHLLGPGLLGGKTPFGWLSYPEPIEPEKGLPATVDLWALREKPVTRALFEEVCGSMELAKCRRDDISEAFLLRGLVPSRLILLRANLVSPSVEPDPFLADIAQSGSRVRLWTYRVSPSRFGVSPHCPPPVSDAKRAFGPLGGLFSRLSRPPKQGCPEPAAASASGDRRRFERRPVQMRASVGIAGAGDAGREAIISDLSTRGAFLTDVTLRTGLVALRAGKVILRSTAGGRPFYARGCVVRLNVQRKSVTLAIEFSGRPRLGTSGSIACSVGHGRMSSHAARRRRVDP